MRCPTMNELSPPPPGKTGWPWTEESPQLPDKMPDGSAWPRISIVTPSLNQGQFIEETIRSVLLQGYPDLEYIIIDGGSSDGSVEIIKKYKPWLAYWVSEPDKGQAHAINKGFAKSTGEIFAYINSDDLYEPGAFKLVALQFRQKKALLVAGECVIFDEHGVRDIYVPFWPQNINLLLTKCPFAQPASFWHSEFILKTEGMDESLGFCFDMEFFLRNALYGISPKLVNEKLARWRIHSKSKTMSQSLCFQKDLLKIVQKHHMALNINNNERDKIINTIEKEIEYLNVFLSWKSRGRFYAMVKFIHFIARSPSLLFRRKILGMAKRLFFYKTTNVVELNKS